MLVADVLGGSAFRYWDSPVWLLSDGCPGGGGCRRWLTATGRSPLAVPCRARVCWWGRLSARPVRLPLGGRSDAPYLPGEALS